MSKTDPNEPFCDDMDYLTLRPNFMDTWRKLLHGGGTDREDSQVPSAYEFVFIVLSLSTLLSLPLPLKDTQLPLISRFLRCRISSSFSVYVSLRRAASMLLPIK